MLGSYYVLIVKSTMSTIFMLANEIKFYLDSGQVKYNVMYIWLQRINVADVAYDIIPFRLINNGC